MNTSSSSNGAAFIDLDRTLLSGASGPIISAALRNAGVVSATRLPGEDALYRIFNAVGENLPSMLLARQGAAVMKGKARHDVVAAAQNACDDLLQLVRPLAASVIAGHREAGRKVVLATTTPNDVIATFARRMGFDDVVATRFAVDEQGLYTGELDGPFTWSAGKLAAVRTWCSHHHISLSESYAYSDSVYDEPLLNAVGFPQVVNPDARLTVMAAARRWPIVSFDNPDAQAKPPLQSSDIQKVGLLFARPEVFPFVKFSFTGVENIPSSGPVVLVANHRSYFDVFAVALTVAKSGRTFCWRDGGDYAARDDPTRASILRSAASWKVGGSKVGANDQCDCCPDWFVGHREGVAAKRSLSKHSANHEPARRASGGWQADAIRER